MKPYKLLDTLMLDIDQLHPNSWNPNVMDDDTKRLTRLSMEEEGFSDPVDVAPCPEHDDYVILDGEHRWLVAQELGYAQIPVFVKDRGGDDAVITTIRKDRTHGEPDLIKMADIVGTLIDELGPEEVTRRLGFDTDEQQAMLELTRWDIDAYGTAGQDALDASRAEWVTWSVPATSETLQMLEQLLPQFADIAVAGPHGDGELGRLVALVEDAVNRT